MSGVRPDQIIYQSALQQTTHNFTSVIDAAFISIADPEPT